LTPWFPRFTVSLQTKNRSSTEKRLDQTHLLEWNPQSPPGNIFRFYIVEERFVNPSTCSLRLCSSLRQGYGLASRAGRAGGRLRWVHDEVKLWLELSKHHNSRSDPQVSRFKGPLFHFKAEPYFISEVTPSVFVMLGANFVETRRRDKKASLPAILSSVACGSEGGS